MVQKDEKENTPSREEARMSSISREPTIPMMPKKKEYPPAAGTPIVFGLDDDGVEESDNQKCADTDDDSPQMVFR